MKKGLLLTIIAVIVLLITGCSSSTGHGTNKTISNNDSKTTTKAESIFYDGLSSADKKNMKFNFKEAQDETSDNRADPV